MHTILVINPGSTSTKLALFHDMEPVVKEELHIDSAEIAKYSKVSEQLPMRSAMVHAFMEKHGIRAEDLDIIAARGGALPPTEGGAYKVDEGMIRELVEHPMAQHASSLACMIGFEIARGHDVPVIIYDCPGSDEFTPEAKRTGLPEVEIIPVSHVLNTRKVARDVAREMGKAYEECNFIVAHLGGGISINVHEKGRIVDSVYDDMGPMSPQRAGRIPSRFMVGLCYSGQYTKDQMKKKLWGQGGLAAYLGTQDLRKIKEMIEGGDTFAQEILQTMAYQVAKGIGELAPVVSGDIDRIILTGGGAHLSLLADCIAVRVTFLAPVVVVPGEREMEALAEGGLRVLRGLEEAKAYVATPAAAK